MSKEKIIDLTAFSVGDEVSVPYSLDASHLRVFGVIESIDGGVVGVRTPGGTLMKSGLAWVRSLDDAGREQLAHWRAVAEVDVKAAANRLFELWRLGMESWARMDPIPPEVEAESKKLRAEFPKADELVRARIAAQASEKGGP